MEDFLQFGIDNGKDSRHYKAYWLDARWDKDDERWEWVSTGEAIEWGKCVPGSYKIVQSFTPLLSVLQPKF